MTRTRRNITKGSWSTFAKPSAVTPTTKESATTMNIVLTEAQLTSLDAIGVFEAPQGDEVRLRAAIHDGRLVADASEIPSLASIVNDLSNYADRLADQLADDYGKWARHDARVLSNLYVRLSRLAP